MKVVFEMVQHEEINSTITLRYQPQREYRKIIRTSFFKELIKKRKILTKRFHSKSLKCVLISEKILHFTNSIIAVNDSMSKISLERYEHIYKDLKDKNFPLFDKLILIKAKSLKGKVLEEEKNLLLRDVDLCKKEIQKENNDLLEAIHGLSTFLNVKSSNFIKNNYLFCCSNCDNVFFDDPQGTKCPFCRKKIIIKNCKKIPYSNVVPEFMLFIQNNIWYEEGIRQSANSIQEVQTKGRGYLRGCSGVDHEIDLTVYHKTNGFIIFECKTKPIKLEDLSKLILKKLDVGAIHAIFASSQKCDDKSILKIAKYFDISIISDTFNNITDAERKIKRMITNYLL